MPKNKVSAQTFISQNFPYTIFYYNNYISFADGASKQV